MRTILGPGDPNFGLNVCSVLPLSHSPSPHLPGFFCNAKQQDYKFLGLGYGIGLHLFGFYNTIS